MTFISNRTTPYINFKRTGYNLVKETSTPFQVLLALLLRAGFILVQLGSIPTENISTILLQNIVDIAISLLSFGMLGFMFAFGKYSHFGLIGYGTTVASDPKYLKNAGLGFVACLTGSAIKTTLLSARLHIIGCLLSSFFYSGICQPIIMHWLWHENGWMRNISFLNRKYDTRDRGGDLVIHVTSSMSGLVGSIFLGRRLLRLNEIHPSSIGMESSGNSLAGYFFILLGLLAINFLDFNSGNNDPDFNVLLINVLTATGTGLLTTVILHYLLFGTSFSHWALLRCPQGAMAGLITIANGIHVYEPAMSYGMATLGAATYYFTTLCIYRSALEDYCNTMSIHLICGCLGAILPPLVSRSKYWGSKVDAQQRFLHMIWQLLFLLVVIAFTVGIFVFLFFLINLLGFLRNKQEKISHQRSENAANNIRTTCFLKRVFKKNTSFIQPGHSIKSFHWEDNDSFCSSEVVSTVYPDPANNKQPTEVFYNAMYCNNPWESCLRGKQRQEQVLERIQAKIRRCHLTLPHNNLTDTKTQTGCGDFSWNDTKEKVCIEKKVKPPSCTLQRKCRSETNLYKINTLHRTKKETNLSRHRLIKYDSKPAKKQKIKRENVNASPVCIFIDKMYNDGFITLKAPPNNEKFISTSDDEKEM